MATPFRLYRVSGTAGNVGTPGAPILSFDLLVNSSTGNASGHASIVQTLPPPLGTIHISNATGKVTNLVFGGTVSHGVALQGTYVRPVPPIEPIVIEEKFAAHFVVDVNWDGRGSFEYGGSDVNDVPVTSVLSTPIQPLYGVVIHGATATGDLARMKEVAAAAEQYLAQVPDVQKALANLKGEIAKA
jgi:Domain of unknown function (DUF1843)/Domain of unknown function (DUF1842)